MPVEKPPRDFIGAMHDATALEGPALEQAATELWNISVKTRIHPDGELLTDREKELVSKLGECAGLFSKIYEEDTSAGKVKATTHSHDLNEVVTFIHALQARVLARAAARRYSDYRLL